MFGEEGASDWAIGGNYPIMVGMAIGIVVYVVFTALDRHKRVANVDVEAGDADALAADDRTADDRTADDRTADVRPADDRTAAASPTAASPADTQDRIRP